MAMAFLDGPGVLDGARRGFCWWWVPTPPRPYPRPDGATADGPLHRGYFKACMQDWGHSMELSNS